MKSLDSSRYRILVILLITAFVTVGELKAQDPYLSQFYNNPIYYNPANIGLNPGFRVRFNYRDQWAGMPEHYRTYNCSLDAAERSLPGSGGVGLLFLSDKAGNGLLKTNTAGIGTSVHVILTEKILSQVGIMVSYVQKSLNWDALVYPDQLHSRYGNIYLNQFNVPDMNRVTYPDFSVGGVFRYFDTQSRGSGVQGTMGVAVHHVFQPNESILSLDSPLPRKLVITGDLVIELNARRSSSYGSNRNSGPLKLNPAFIYERQADFSTFSIGLNMLKSNFYLGAWYRNNASDLFQASDAIFSIGINAPFNQETRIKIMYSYDYILTEFRNAAGSTHEISIVWELDKFSLFGGNSRGGYNSGYRGRGNSDVCSPF